MVEKKRLFDVIGIEEGRDFILFCVFEEEEVRRKREEF